MLGFTVLFALLFLFVYVAVYLVGEAQRREGVRQAPRPLPRETAVRRDVAARHRRGGLYARPAAAAAGPRSSFPLSGNSMGTTAQAASPFSILPRVQ